LVLGDSQAQPGLARGLFRRPTDHARPDVGVSADLVGMGVVLGVLGDPVAVADPGPQVAARQTDRPVEPSRPEGLAVTGVVAQECHLSEHRSQVCRDKQLVPRVPQYEQGGPPGPIKDADQPQSH